MVIEPFKKYVKILSLLNESLSLTKAVEALIIIITGASIINANAYATPYAARLNFGSANLAINAARKGPSTAIINQVAPSGIQKVNIFVRVNSWLFSDIKYWNNYALNERQIYK